jgi:hypothetical protein
MVRPEKLFHATPTHEVESIMKYGLKPAEWTSENPKTGERKTGADPVNLSTDDETSLIAFFGDGNGCIGESGEAVDTITLLEVDCVGLELEWPGEDGPHHYLCPVVIPPDRLRAVQTCSLADVDRGHRGEPLTPEALDGVFGNMESSHAAYLERKTV